MAKLTSEQIKESYKKLPEDLKDAIFSVDSSEIIMNVAKKYNLNIESTGELADETGLVMLGITQPKNYVFNLAKRLNVSQERAGEIANEINNKIFSKVRESLKKVHNITEDEIAVAGEPENKLKKEDIIKEIQEEPATEEKKVKEQEAMPEIMKGLHRPSESPFDAKTKGDIFRMPPKESEHRSSSSVPKPYPGGDPYREPIE